MKQRHFQIELVNSPSCYNSVVLNSDCKKINMYSNFRLLCTVFQKEAFIFFLFLTECDNSVMAYPWRAKVLKLCKVLK